MDSGRDYERPDHGRRLSEKIPEKKRPEPKKKKTKNSTFLFVTYFTVFLFLGLMAYFVYFQVAQAKSVISSPYNARLDAFANRIVRGSILASGREVLAETVTTESGETTRSYPYGAYFSHVVGYNTHGKAGLELSENASLLTSNAYFAEKIKNSFLGEKNVGDNIITTLDVSLQQAAYNALGSHNGAVIALDPATGEIKAMVSKPDFDPNTIDANWDALNEDANQESVLLNRALSGAYAPGSTFKIVTALSYMRQNAGYESYAYTCTGSIQRGETVISCFNQTAHGNENLMSSFANSCNASFANIGLSLDIDAYAETAEDLLFNKELPLASLSARESQFVLSKDSTQADIMMTAMGQGETLTSPYHMALIAAAIANDGVLMKPYLVASVENYTGSTVKTTKAKEAETLMTDEEAAVLTSYMQAVVQSGTGRELSGLSYSVAGKTGTAEYSSNKEESHSWFVGFSNVEDPDLVVCVIVEGYDNSSDGRAVPVAKQIFDAYYNR